MGNGNIELSGSITAGKVCGGGCGDGGSAKVQALSLGCRQAYTGAVVSADVPLSISSPNAFVDLPLLEQLSSVEFLFASFSAPVTLRVDAEVAELLGVGGIFPTGFVGAETLTMKVDAYASFTTTFTSGDQSAAQVAARINAAAMIAGYPFVPVTVDVSGQLKVTGKATGDEGAVLVTGGTAQASLGFAASSNDEVHGDGEDLPVYGLFLCEFEKARAPSRIQVKGSSSEVTLMAAGPSATG